MPESVSDNVRDNSQISQTMPESLRQCPRQRPNLSDNARISQTIPNFSGNDTIIRFSWSILKVCALWWSVDCTSNGTQPRKRPSSSCGGRWWPGHVWIEFGRNRFDEKSRSRNHPPRFRDRVAETRRSTADLSSKNVPGTDLRKVCRRWRWKG